MNNGVPQIPGVRPPQDVRDFLQALIAGVLGRNSRGFPGAQPVSFARHHIQELMQQDYYLCEKTDGIRCLLWLDEDTEQNESCYLIDRKNDYYFLEGAHFPKANDPSFRSFHTQTLLDGELVYDTIQTPQGPRKTLRFLVFDLMVLEKENVMGKPLASRLGRLREFVTKPYNKWLEVHQTALATQPFQLKAKDMDFSYALSQMFSQKLPNLPHGNDGLIFTCINTFYKSGTDENIIKWKPPHENTIDFRLELQGFPMFDPEDGEAELIPDYDAMPIFGLLIGMGDRKFKEFEKLYLEEEDWEAMKRMNQVLDGRIIECYRDDKGRWRFKKEEDGSPRFRDDKTDPNHYTTVNKVIASIKDGVTQEELIQAEGQMKQAWKARAAKQKGEQPKQPDREDAARRQAHARKHSIDSEENGAKRMKMEE